MKNNLYIDGTDAFTRFGVFIAEGGHNEVVAFPALKAPEVSINIRFYTYLYMKFLTIGLSMTVSKWICRILNLILKNLK